MQTPTGIDRERVVKHLPKMSQAAVRGWIDGVVFDDGEFSGPNRSFVFDYYVAAGKRFHETVRELHALKTQPDLALRAKLSEMSKEAPEWVAQGWTISFRSTFARYLQNTLDQKGRDAYEKALAALKSPVPSVRKH
jgi:hypothetical protein